MDEAMPVAICVAMLPVADGVGRFLDGMKNAGAAWRCHAPGNLKKLPPP